MNKSNINPDLRASMMRYDLNKDRKLTANEVKSAINKFDGSDDRLIKDIIDNTVNAKSLTPEDKTNLTNIISKAPSIEPRTVIFGKANGLEVLKEKNNVSSQEQKINLDIFSGKNSKYVGSSKELTTQKYLQTISKFKITNVQPMSAPLLEIHTYVASSGSPRSSSKIRNLYMSKLTEAKQENGKSINENLRNAIINSPKQNLDLSHVLKIALDTTKGDYGLAVAGLSNIFKSATYEMRDTKNSADSIDKFFTKDFAINNENFDKDIKMISKLGNLRKDTKNQDKMGMWYHFFNIQATASYYGEGKTNFGIMTEHSTRGLAPVFKALKDYGILTSNAASPADKEKAALDNMSIDIFKKLAGF